MQTDDDLSRLAGAAAEADADALPPPPAGLDAAGQPVPLGPDYATEAAGAVEFFTAMATGYCPATSQIWTDQTKQRVSAALAPVFEKYAFSLGAMPPEVILLIVAGPPLFATARAIAAQVQSDRQKAAKEAAKPEEKKEAPEVLRHPQVDLYK